MIASIFFILLIFFGSSCTSNKPKNTNRKIAYNKSNTDSIQCPEFLSLIDNHKPNTVAKALKILASREPSYFNNYILAYDSRSLQHASFQNPRAIVYGSDAKMTLTFNGNSSQDGYESIELMCFNNNIFEFYDITFPNEVINKDKLTYLAKEDLDKEVIISPVNGYKGTIKDCTSCHQTPVRPNWESYNLWPGICKFHLPNAHIVTNEMQYCNNFSKTKLKHDRYNFLKKNYQVNIDGPELQFGIHLSKLNAKRIIQEIVSRKEQLLPQRDNILKTFICSSMDTYKNISTFNVIYPDVDITALPIRPLSQKAKSFYEFNINTHAYKLKNIENFYGENNFSYLNTTSQNKNQQEAISFLKSYLKIDTNNYKQDYGLLDAAHSIEEVIVLANLEPIMKEVGINIKNWSMAFGGGYTFEAGYNGVQGFASMPGLFLKDFIDQFYGPEHKVSKLLKVYENNTIYNNEKLLHAKDQLCTDIKLALK